MSLQLYSVPPAGYEKDRKKTVQCSFPKENMALEFKVAAAKG